MTISLDDALRLYPGAQSYRIGDGPEMNARLLAMMRRGEKTATCLAAFEVDEGVEADLEVGRVDIGLDWEGRPALATRTLAAERLRFSEMDEARVPPQGEFDDLEDWRRGYTAQFQRMGRFDPEMVLIYERFEVVRDFAEDADVS